MKAYEEFRMDVVKRYHEEYGCGKEMSIEVIQREFDLSVGRHGYDELVRVEKLCKSRNEAFDPEKRALTQMDMAI